MLLVLIILMMNQLGLNSRNSSKPPSTDPNRNKKKKPTGDRKVGGQKRHTGTTLQQFDSPDFIEDIPLDRKTLPEGMYKDAGFESRQVVDIDISRIVTEYRAQILEDANGKKFTAPFPEGVTRPVQYGLNVKVHSVYMSQYQLVPYKRIEEDFQDQVKIPNFKGVLCHDHWKPYFKLDCHHALCNAHHLRELERAWEQDKQSWARDMRDLLLQISQAGTANRL